MDVGHGLLWVVLSVPPCSQGGGEESHPNQRPDKWQQQPSTHWLPGLVKKAEFNVVTWSILSAQTCPQRQTAPNAISDHFPTSNVTSTFFFAMLWLVVVSLWTPKLSKKRRGKPWYCRICGLCYLTQERGKLKKGLSEYFVSLSLSVGYCRV